jgi:hypothetical protein
MPDIAWIFDPTPASGKRRGGNPSEYAFEGDLETFVREVIQNANDQRQANGDSNDDQIEVELRLFELVGERFEDFKSAIAWPTLSPHLNGARAVDGESLLAQYMQELEETGRMLLLRVEDRNAVGLTGEEFEDRSHFTALCKDDLVSHKQDNSAGGSYGLGKSLLWSFSGLSTVLFCSNLHEDPPGHESPRLIGRSELASHQADTDDNEQWYTGSGWFGRRVVVHDRAQRAESVWSDGARDLAESLYLSRPSVSGTSILVTGFRDPTDEVNRPVRDLVSSMHDAAGKFFWPALTRSYDELAVEVGSEDEVFEVTPDEVSEIAPFVECYRKLDNATLDVEEFRDPGSIIRREIPFEIPERRDGKHHGTTGRVTLIVRLASGVEEKDLLDHVAMVRGPGMVVRYWRKSNLSMGARPFHAVLLAGHAHPPEHREPGVDADTENFLRASEPPGHDKWKSTQALKSAYKRGYATALINLHQKITKVLKSLVVAQPASGKRGPDKLRKRFPLPSVQEPDTPNPPAARPFHFQQFQATFDGERWHFEGSVHTDEEHDGWRLQLSLWSVSEEGEQLANIGIEGLSPGSIPRSMQISEPTAELVFDSTVSELQFSGRSERLSTKATSESALEIDLDAEFV